MDEYELTDHYNRWEEDLQLMATLGVRYARYGIPWHRIQPARDKWNWEWTDAVLERMLSLGITPIVDLVHYGVPAWIQESFLNPQYPQLVAEYSSAVAERYRGKIGWYTPFNEPRIAAWYCGRIGWWPPFRKSWQSFLQILVQIAKGVVLTQKALHSIDPEIVSVQVDATDLYATSNPELQSEVQLRQEIVFLAQDLVHGNFGPNHFLFSLLAKNGILEEDLSWFQVHHAKPDILGINMYPMFSQKTFLPRGSGVRVVMPYASGELVERLVRMYFERYGDRIMITETASLGSTRKRIRWLHDSVDAVKKLQKGAVPVIGYTWWPMFSLVAWAYRQTKKPMQSYLLRMGLWDLDPATLARIRTPVVDEFIKVVHS